MSRWSVLGSGVSGLCIATLLAERGENVEIITLPDCRAASHWAGGMLAPGAKRKVRRSRWWTGASMPLHGGRPASAALNKRARW